MPAAVLCGLAVAACGEPPFRVHVTFPQSVEIEPGARVVYQGLTVGEVESISLQQPSPREPAAVRLTLAISNPDVTIREADRFHVTSESLLGDTIVRIIPAPETSQPVEAGATLAGVPPFVTRAEESVDAAIDALSDAVSETARGVLDQLVESLEGQREPTARERAPGGPVPEAGPPDRAPGASGAP